MFTDLREGLTQKRGVPFLRGVDTPMHTMENRCVRHKISFSFTLKLCVTSSLRKVAMRFYQKVLTIFQMRLDKEIKMSGRGERKIH